MHVQPLLDVRGVVDGQVVRYDVDLVVCVRLTGFVRNTRILTSRARWHSPNTSPALTFNAAIRLVTSCRRPSPDKGR